MSVDRLGTSRDQCRSMVQYNFTSTETRRLVRTDSPGRPPRLSHSSWTMNKTHRIESRFYIYIFCCCCCCWLDNILLEGVCVHFSARTILQAGVNKAHSATRFLPVSVRLADRSNTITATIDHSCISVTSSVSTKLSWPHSTGLRVSDTTFSITVWQSSVPARQKEIEEARTHVF